MVADLLVPAEAGGDAEDRGHVAAELPFLSLGFGGLEDGTHWGDGAPGGGRGQAGSVVWTYE